MTYRTPVPKLFADLGPTQGLLFTCIGCTRATAMGREEALERWGKEGRVADVARRFTCRNCRRRGAAVEMIRGKVFSTTTERDRVMKGLSPIDRLVRELEVIKPAGRVS